MTSQHRTRESLGALRSPRDFERDGRFGEGALGAYDSLRHRRLGDEKGARDLVGREPAEQSQRQGDPGLAGEYGVTRDEDEPEEIIAHVVVDPALRVGPLRATAWLPARSRSLRASAQVAFGVGEDVRSRDVSPFA